jgi:hypothetical protein
MTPNLTLLIFICTFLVPEAIVLGWRRFLHSKYEAKNGTLNLLYHIFCMFLLYLEFNASYAKTLMLWGFMSLAFIGMIALFCGVAVGREFEVILSNNFIYKSFKMFGHPYVIFPITMTVSFITYIFPF